MNIVQLHKQLQAILTCACLIDWQGTIQDAKGSTLVLDESCSHVLALNGLLAYSNKHLRTPPQDLHLQGALLCTCTIGGRETPQAALSERPWQISPTQVLEKVDNRQSLSHPPWLLSVLGVQVVVLLRCRTEASIGTITFLGLRGLRLQHRGRALLQVHNFLQKLKADEAISFVLKDSHSDSGIGVV